MCLILQRARILNLINLVIVESTAQFHKGTVIGSTDAFVLLVYSPAAIVVSYRNGRGATIAIDALTNLQIDERTQLVNYTIKSKEECDCI